MHHQGGVYATRHCVNITHTRWIMLIFTLPAHRQQTPHPPTPPPHNMGMVTAASVNVSVRVHGRTPCRQTDLHVKRTF